MSDPARASSTQTVRHTPRSLTALLARWADRITVERGIRYAKDAAVVGLSTEINPDNKSELWLSARVSGSEPGNEYQTRVSLSPGEEDWGDIEGECSCPVRFDCKHAVAVVWTWAAQTGQVRADAAAAVSVSASTEADSIAPPAPIARKRFFPAAVDGWLQKTIGSTSSAEPSAERKSGATINDSIAYVLSADGSLAALKVRKLRDGGYKRSTTAASLAWIRHEHRTPAYVNEIDEPILRLIEGLQTRGQFEPRVRLAGQTGYQILRMALATGRAFWDDGEAQATLRIALRLNEAASRPTEGSLQWAARATANNNPMGYTLVWQPPTGAPQLVLGTAPTLALDLEAGALTPIHTQLSVSTLERLLALPPLLQTDLTTWRFVVDAWRAFGDAAHIPALPFRVEPLPEPIAVLHFALAEVQITQGWGKYAKESNVIAPTVELLYQYPDGSRVAPQPSDFAAPVEEHVQDNRVVAESVRNLRAEKTWALRLPPKLLSLADVEPALRYAMTNAQRLSLFALPRHAWSTDGPRVLADAQAAGFRMEIDHGFPLTLEDIPEPELELIPAAENGWYRFALGVDIGGHRVDLAPAFARLIAAQRDPQDWLDAIRDEDKILLSLADGRVVRLNGGRIRAMLAPVFAWFQGGVVDEISGLQAALLPSQVIYRGRDNDTWLAMREKLQAGAKLEAIVPTAQFQAQLRPYQLSGLAWLSHLHELKMSGVLADDMGLGKTVQTLAHLQRVRSLGDHKRPHLIIAPTSVISNWNAEAARFAPSVRVHTHHGKDRTLTKKEWGAADVVVTSYPILQRDAGTFAKLEWDAVVFDEAQMLKNPRAKTYQAAQSLNAQQRLALTGTPMENHLGELWSLFNVLSPGLLGDLETFNRHFRHRIEQSSDTDRMNILRARIRPFLLRRTRDEVVKELPEKTETIRWIDLDSAQADLYETLRTAIHDDVRKAIDKKGLKQSTIHILDALLKLRQACCDPRLVKLPDGKSRADAPSAKLDWLLEHVPILVEEGRRILIFSQFTSMLAIIEAALTQAGIKTVVLTGDTTDRDTPIAQFQNGEVPVFLLSLKAGGVGLNLTAADTVIHYDPWWNPAVEAQATARAHRIGQDKPVFVYKLIARGTLEEKMLAMIARKQQLAEALLAGGSAALTGITAKDVDDLLAPIETLAPVETVSE